MLIEQSFLFVYFSSLVIAKERSTHRCFLLVIAFHHPLSHFSITKERSAQHYFLFAKHFNVFYCNFCFFFKWIITKKRNLHHCFLFYAIISSIASTKFFHLIFFFCFVCDLVFFFFWLLLQWLLVQEMHYLQLL